MNSGTIWREIVERVSAAIKLAYPDATSLPTFVDELAIHVANARTAWPLIVDYEAGDYDKRGDLLSAPLFTSPEYPWPQQDGKWCEPIVQLDLERWGELSGRDVGKGLLQVWEPVTGGLIRVLPVAALEVSPSPLPSMVFNDYMESVAECDFETGRPEWLDKPGRIIGFGTPYFHADGYHMKSLIETVIQFEPENGVLILTESLTHILSIIGDPDPDHEHHAFGMCGGNIFNTSVHLPPVLLTIENDDRVYATMGSTLCICYEEKADGFVYSAHLFWE